MAKDPLSSNIGLGGRYQGPLAVFSPLQLCPVPWVDVLYCPALAVIIPMTMLVVVVLFVRQDFITMPRLSLNS